MQLTAKQKNWLQFRISEHDANGWESYLNFHGDILQQTYNSTTISKLDGLGFKGAFN